MRDRIVTALLVLTLAVWPLATATAAAAPSREMKIEPAKTRIGMAKVKLRFSEARIDDEGLVATYHLTNLFLEPKMDAGEMRLDSDQPLGRLLESGGPLMGRAHSVVSGQRHPVSIRLRPDGTLRIDIRMGHRLMTFETRYHLVP